MISRRHFCVLLPGAATFLSNSASASSQPESSTSRSEREEIDWSFSSPPLSSRPYVLWMWMGSNISQAGITRDLEAMKDAGIGGATIFSLADITIPWAGTIGKSPTPEVVTFTEPWWALIKHAAIEAHRLGLELILHNCAGYESSAGPWITPEMSMQEVIWSATPATGGTTIERNLPRAKVDPHPHADFPQRYMPELGRVDVAIVEARETYYRDIAVIAMPREGVATMDQVLMISEHMDEHGHLVWNAPAGDWIVYRFGHTTTGAMMQPAQLGALGLECDKMNKAAVAFHVQHVLDDMKKHLGDLMGKSLTTLYFDSYEAGDPDWTPKMREEFRARRGYDLTRYLPVFAGRTVGSASDTERFKADHKRTKYDLYRDCYWATPGPLAHAAGVKFVAEPYDGPWVIGEVVKYLDIPAVEFWTHGGKYSPQSLDPVVEAAHLLGDKLIVAESFTSDPHEAQWNEHPAWLKPIGDAAFCAGVMRYNLHHFVQQPWDAKYKPGNTMGQWGVHFGRNQTWWEPGKAWLAYVWRCQNLLQRGDFVAPTDTARVDFSSVSPEGVKADLKSIHRRIGGASVFFVASAAAHDVAATVSFTVTGMQPELWDPVWGTTRDLTAFTQREGVTTVDLAFAPAQSFFVVFRKPVRKRPSASNNFPHYLPVAELEGSWRVSFDSAWGGPPEVVLATLTDWTLHPDEGVKYYSGTAVYRKTMHVDGTHTGKKLFLDIGKCNHLAEVTVNGKKLGVLWTAPWRIEVGHALVSGDNHIEIAVTNVWANRLIGDEQQPLDFTWEIGDAKITPGQFMKEFPDWFLNGTPRPSAKRYTFTTWNYFNKDSKLIPSGLLGPVRLMSEQF